MQPLDLLRAYRNLEVEISVNDAAGQVCRLTTCKVKLREYFMMDWTAGTDERNNYDLVSAGSRRNTWFQTHKDRIRNAAMGKGAPRDYELALEWCVRAGKLPLINPVTLQNFSDNSLGIDCSGFANNYLIAAGKKTYSNNTVRNTGAASYYDTARAINDPLQIRRGDLLVWMSGNRVMRGPGHVR